MTEEPKGRAPKILIVEDEADTRVLLRAMLQAGSRPYEVQEASGGEQAISIAKRFVPDLVLLDIVLTDIDGVAVLQALKRDPTTRRTRVVLVTARADERMIRTALTQGADDYLTKPFTQERLLAAVERYLDA
jgi:CheY-like chemotaxis protein